MSTGLLTCITILLVVGLFLLWRIPIGLRVKRKEQEFIENNKGDSAILIFYGDELELKELELENVERIESYYGKWTYAIPSGEYDSVAIFSYSYRDPNSGSGRSSLGYTGRVYLELSLTRGSVYRYRIKNQTAISKKQPYKILMEKTVVTKPLTYLRLEHTVVFEQLL